MGLPLFSAGATKVEDGVSFPKAAFAYTPSDTPSTWKLRLWESPAKKITSHQVGMAVAALGAGFRGNKVAIPAADLASVKRKVLHAWHVANPDRKDIPEVLQAGEESMDGVAPPGWEHSIKRMKKNADISNPYALSWWMKNRGAHPTQHASLDASAEDRALEKNLIRQQKHLPPICVAAARGEAWAQAQLLSEGYPPLVVEGRW